MQISKRHRHLSQGTYNIEERNKARVYISVIKNTIVKTIRKGFQKILDL